MTWSRWLLVVLVVCFSALFGVDGANAQAIDWWSIGISVPRDPGSPRLDGIGGLRNVIPDEEWELNLSDYGGILSGELYDSDGRRWETWVRSVDRKSDDYSTSGTRTRYNHDGLEAGGRITWRAEDKQFLGLDYSYDELSTDVADGEGAKIRGPWWGTFAGRSIGRFIVGGGIHFVSDNEDLLTSDVFSIRHHSSGIEYVGSLGYRTDKLEIGLQAEHEVSTITGVSRDESRFHEDELIWKRPVRNYTGAVLWNPTESLKGMVRARVVRIDGREEAEISWSDRMPQNPGRENFRTTTGTFTEMIRAHDIGTRWEVRPFRALLLAADFYHRSGEDEVEEGKNFKGSRRSQHTKSRLSYVIGGFGYETPGRRLRFGVEGGMERSVFEEELLGGDSETTSRQLLIRGGVEYFLTDLVALRGGYFRSASDADLDAPRSLYIGNEMTFGIGYFPRGGLIQIDAAIRMLDYTPDYGGDPRYEESRMIFSMGARFLL